MLFVFILMLTAPSMTNTLSLHDALPIYGQADAEPALAALERGIALHEEVEDVRQELRVDPRALIADADLDRRADRKSTRLNSSHSQISYAVFCLKKKRIIGQRLTSQGDY